MICGPADEGYNTQPANTPDAIRNLIIGQYREWQGARCPEAAGYKNWVSYVNQRAWEIWGSKPGIPDLATYYDAYIRFTRTPILVAAEKNGENTILGEVAAHIHCQRAAVEKYGPTAKASYVMNSGNQCIISSI